MSARVETIQSEDVSTDGNRWRDVYSAMSIQSGDVRSGGNVKRHLRSSLTFQSRDVNSGATIKSGDVRSGGNYPVGGWGCPFGWELSSQVMSVRVGTIQSEDVSTGGNGWRDVYSAMTIQSGDVRSGGNGKRDPRSGLTFQSKDAHSGGTIKSADVRSGWNYPVGGCQYGW
ncbi:hypothetical protein ACOME3_010249 [Neoechinorhynchus agilis]